MQELSLSLEEMKKKCRLGYENASLLVPRKTTVSKSAV